MQRTDYRGGRYGAPPHFPHPFRPVSPASVIFCFSGGRCETSLKIASAGEAPCETGKDADGLLRCGPVRGDWREARPPLQERAIQAKVQWVAGLEAGQSWVSSQDTKEP